MERDVTSKYFISDRHTKRRRFQTLAMARLARGHTHEGFVFLFCRIRSGLTVAALYIFDQPLKSHIVHTDAALTAVMHLDGFSVRSVNQDIVDFFGYSQNGVEREKSYSSASASRMALV